VQRSRAGTLILVVGPSGSGKDTLIGGARERLGSEGVFSFPGREITRPAASGGEDHLPLSAVEFDARRAAGRYALHWEAHGLGYGIPATIGDSLAAGRHVVINVSRGVIVEARGRFAPVRVIAVRVSPGTLKARLEARGREDAAAIAARLARAEAYGALDPEVVPFDNDGPLAEAVERFVALLGRLTPRSL
jgi:phosphonate metabolism protein PhnN/1,5-bisphosphokinase (PRPP-forming)